MKYNNLSKIVGVILIILFCSKQIFACEPIIPLMLLIGGSNLITRSLIGLIIGVGIKCITFAFFEKSLTKTKAIWLMLLANILTTVIGLFVALFLFSAPMLPFIVIGIIFIYVLAYFPANRLKLIDNKYLNYLTPKIIATIMVVLLISTYFFFALAMHNQGINSLYYWLFKLAYIYPAIIISIFLTTLWEENIIFNFIATPNKKDNYFTSVIRANLITMLVLMSIAAIKTLPNRLISPDFLTF